MKSSTLWTAWLRTGATSKRTLLIDAASGRNWTGTELNNAAEAAVSKLGNLQDAVVAFCLPNGIDWLGTFLALQKVSGVALPLDASLPPDARRHTAGDLGADFLFEDGGLISLERGSRRTPRACCIKVTSGTGGALKSVACSAENLLADGRQIIRAMGIKPADRNLAIIPLGHSYGLGNLVMPLILQGTPLVTAAQFTPRQVLEWIPKHKITVLPSVPAVFKMLADLDGEIRPLRLAISAGAALSAETARAFFDRHGVRIHNFLGSSETGGIAYDRAGDASLSGRAVGKPIAGAKVSIARNGRITVSGKAVAAPGRFILPDTGKWNSRGEVQLTGRAGAIANVGGKKVHPAEVEKELRAIPGVSDAWVAVFSEMGRDFLGAAVETQLGQAQLEAQLSKTLAPWKLPRRYLVASALPRTARGKLDTARLKSGILEPAASHPGSK